MKMGGVAPRFLILLAAPFPLLRRRHHRNRNLFVFSSHSLRLSSSSSFSFSSSPSPPSPLPLKASQRPSHTSPWPEWSSFLSHISSAGYLPSLPDHAFAAGELPHSFLRDATACLVFARHRPNLLRLLSTRDIAAVIEHASPFLFRDAEDSVRNMKSFLSTGPVWIFSGSCVPHFNWTKIPLMQFGNGNCVPHNFSNLTLKNPSLLSIAHASLTFFSSSSIRLRRS